MNFLKKLFFKEVQDDLKQLQTKIMIMNDKHSLFNKRITIELGLDQDKCIINDMYHYLTQHIASDGSGRGNRPCLIIDKINASIDMSVDTSEYTEGYYSHTTLQKATYLLVLYKYTYILLRAREQFIKVNTVTEKAHYFEKLKHIHELADTALNAYSEEYILRIDRELNSSEEAIINEIVKEAEFKESQILSNAISDADLLAERNKIYNMNKNVDYIYELVAVSDTSFELHFSSKKEDDIVDKDNIFISHNFLCKNILDKLSSIVINTKFFTESDN